MATLVFDIGGTRTRAGLFNARTSTLVRSVAAATPNHLDFPESSFEQLSEQLLALMHRLGAELVDQRAVSEIGVAFAGPIGPAGDVLAAPTIWGTAASVGGVPGYLVAYGYVLGSFILGAVIYLASKSYNAKKGIDLSLAFKEIPPE